MKKVTPEEFEKLTDEERVCCKYVKDIKVKQSQIDELTKKIKDEQQIDELTKENKDEQLKQKYEKMLVVMEKGQFITEKDSAHECTEVDCCKVDGKKAFYHSESACHRLNKDKVKELTFR